VKSGPRKGPFAGSFERGQDETRTLIHPPLHASWLNQIELWFSIVRRKALTPNDFGSLEELTGRLALAT
jgi:hypothetical protein